MKILKTKGAKIGVAAAGTTVAAAVITAVIMLAGNGYRTVAIEELSGTTVVTSEEKGATEAYEGMHLYPGDDVAVQQASDMTMVLDMDKYLYAEAGTRFHLEYAGKPGKSETVIHLEEGSVLNRIKDRLNAGEVYQVDTPNSTMAVRGTVLRVSVYRDGTGLSYTQLQVFDGNVQVDLKTEDGEYNGVTAMVEAGQAVLVRGNTDFSEFVIGESGEIASPIDYKDIPQDVAEELVDYIDDGEELSIGKELLMDYTKLEEHQGEKGARVEATCTEDGYEEIRCIICDEVLETAVLPAPGHTVAEWEVDLEATCEVKGHRHGICTVCQSKVEEELEALGHKVGELQTLSEPTCVTVGIREAYCERCNKVMEHLETAATGHTAGDWQTATAATCTEAGTQIRVCTTCGATTETAAIAAAGHQMGEWYTDEEATCTSGGSESRSCSVCGYEESEDTDANGHSGAWQVVTPASCIAGEEQRVCTICGATETREIPATGEHMVTDGVWMVYENGELRECTGIECPCNATVYNVGYCAGCDTHGVMTQVPAQTTLIHSLTVGETQTDGWLVHWEVCYYCGTDVNPNPSRTFAEDVGAEEFKCDTCGRNIPASELELRPE